MSKNIHKFTGNLTVDNVNYEIEGLVYVDSLTVSGLLSAADGIRAFPLEATRASLNGSRLVVNTESFRLGAFANYQRDQTDAIDSATIDTSGDSISISIQGGVALHELGHAVTWGLALQSVDMTASRLSDSTDRISLIKEAVTVRELTAERTNEAGSAFDHFGYATGVERLNQESNSSYRERILDAIANRPGSTGPSLATAINRDLGLGVSPKISISIKSGLDRRDYRFLRVHIQSGKIKIYSMWISNENLNGNPNWRLAKTDQDVEFDFELNSMSVGQLVDQINRIRITSILGGSIAPLTATLRGGADYPAQTLLDFDSRQLAQDLLLSQHKVNLSIGNIFPNSLIFGPEVKATREVETEDSLILQGDYFVDYDKGSISFFRPVEEGGQVSYIHYLREMALNAAPISVIDMQTESAQEIYFEQVLQKLYEREEDKYLNGLPTNAMFALVRRILTSGQRLHYWGE